jgi:UrcA family protein
MTRFFTSTHLIAIALIAGAFGLGFMSGPATAEPMPPNEPFTLNFSYAPDELVSAPKANQLLNRLQRQVTRQCGGNVRMTLDERKFVEACVEQTMSAAVTHIGSETVAQAYKSRTVG